MLVHLINRNGLRVNRQSDGALRAYWKGKALHLPLKHFRELLAIINTTDGITGDIAINLWAMEIFDEKPLVRKDEGRASGEAVPGPS